MKYKSQDITYLTGQHTVGTASSLRPTLSLMGTVVGSMELFWQGQVNCSQLIALHPPHIPQTSSVVPNMLDSCCLCCSPSAKAEHEMGLCRLSLLCAHSWLHPLTSQTLRMQISQNTGTSVLHSLLELLQLSQMQDSIHISNRRECSSGFLSGLTEAPYPRPKVKVAPRPSHQRKDGRHLKAVVLCNIFFFLTNSLPSPHSDSFYIIAMTNLSKSITKLFLTLCFVLAFCNLVGRSIVVFNPIQSNTHLQ